MPTKAAFGNYKNRDRRYGLDVQQNGYNTKIPVLLIQTYTLVQTHVKHIQIYVFNPGFRLQYGDGLTLQYFKMA